MLPSSPHVLSVYEGFSEGLIPTLKELPTEEARKTLCIDSTTCHIGTSQELAQTLAQAQVNIVDAPVSGGACLDPPTISVGLLLNRSRRVWCQGRNPQLPCRGSGAFIHSRSPIPQFDGKTGDSLRTIWLGSCSEDLQQHGSGCPTGGSCGSDAPG